MIEAPGELPELRRADLGSVLVDLRLGPAHRVYDGRRGPRVSLYLDQVEGYGRGRQAVADRVAVAPADEARSENRYAKGPQTAGDVYALAARKRDALGRAVAVPEGQAGDDQRAVYGGVQGDGRDHRQRASSTLLLQAKVPRLYTTASAVLLSPLGQEVSSVPHWANLLCIGPKSRNRRTALRLSASFRQHGRVALKRHRRSA